MPPFFQQRLFLASTIFFLILSPLGATSAFAQEPASEIDLYSLSAADLLELAKQAQANGEFSNINLLPEVYATDLQASLDTNNNLTGTFTADNQSNGFIGSLTYEISIINELPDIPDGQIVTDVQYVYFRELSADLFGIDAGVKQTLSFSTTIPALPAGNHRLRVRLQTATGQKLGWADQTLTITGDNDYVLLDSPATIQVNSTDPVTGQTRDEWQPLEGPNVDPNTTLTLTATARNLGVKTITVTPQIVVTRDLVAGSTSVTTTQESITLPAGATQTLTLPITAASKAGVYEVTLTLLNQDNQPVSSIIDYRYVVMGTSASIISQKVVKLPTTAGESVQIEFTLAGSADRTTPLTGTIEFSLSVAGEEVGSASSPFELKGITASSGEVFIKLTKDICQTPTLHTVVRDNNGNTLTSLDTTLAEISVPDCDLQQQTVKSSNRTLIWTILGITLVILLIIFITRLIIIRRRPQTVSDISSTENAASTKPEEPSDTKTGGTIAALLLATALGAMALLATPATQASGIQWVVDVNKGLGGTFTMNLFVNSPQHNDTVDPAIPINYEAEYSWAACGNQTDYSSLLIQALADGGKVGDISRTDWVHLATSNTDTAPERARNDPLRGRLVYRRGLTFSASFNLPNAEILENTTLLTIGTIWGQRVPHKNYTYDLTWLNFERPDVSVDLKVIDNNSLANPTSGSIDLVSDASGSNNATLSWESSNAETCIATGDTTGAWSGTIPLNSSQVITPAADTHTTYTITCFADAEDIDAGPLPAGKSAADFVTVNTDPDDDDPDDDDPDDDNPVITECSDDRDNDGDGLTDCRDPGCKIDPSQPFNPDNPDANCNSDDDDETNPPFDPGFIIEVE